MASDSFLGEYQLQYSNSIQNIFIDIVDDDVIEPFEFFGLNFKCVDCKTLEFKETTKIIYIEDDDCNFFSIEISSILTI